jgi:hypothetical protein
VELVAKLNKWAAVFKRESLKAWMEAHKYEPVEKARIDVDTQADVQRETERNKRKTKIRNIGCQIDFTSKDNESNLKNAEKKDMACQTEPRSRQKSAGHAAGGRHLGDMVRSGKEGMAQRGLYQHQRLGGKPPSGCKRLDSQGCSR